MSIRTLLIAAGTTLLALPTWAQVEYAIDPAHSSIEFSVRHLGLSNVKGKFTKFEGTIWYNESDIAQSSATVVIQAASIDTAEPKRDEHLRGADFFEVEKYPEIRFRTTGIEPKGDKYVVRGFLVMHGATKEIEIEATPPAKVVDPWGNERMGFEGRTTINRQDFGISYSKVLDNGALVIGNDVKIELNIEALRKKEASPQAKPAKEAKAEEAAQPSEQKKKTDE